MAAQGRPMCDGRGDEHGDHCCYLNGVECPFLERDTIPGRFYSCGLLRELGSWAAVYKDARYQEVVQVEWDKLPSPRKGWKRCGEFPVPEAIGRARCGMSTRESGCCFSRSDSPNVENPFDVEPGE